MLIKNKKNGCVFSPACDLPCCWRSNEMSCTVKTGNEYSLGWWPQRKKRLVVLKDYMLSDILHDSESWKTEDKNVGLAFLQTQQLNKKTGLSARLKFVPLFLSTTSFYLIQSLTTPAAPVTDGVRVLAQGQRMQVPPARPRNACGRHTGIITIHSHGKTAAEARK